MTGLNLTFLRQLLIGNTQLMESLLKFNTVQSKHLERHSEQGCVFDSCYSEAILRLLSATYFLTRLILF